MTQLDEAAPFTPEDRGGYAGRVLDFFVAHPQVRRVLAWRDIEDAEPGPLEVGGYRRRVRLVARAQREGSIDDALAPVDLVAVIEAVIESWLGATVGLRATGGRSTRKRLSENRRAVVETVARITSPV